MIARPPRLIRRLLIIDAALISAFLVGGAVVKLGWLSSQDWLFKLIDLEAESNLPTWFSSMQLLLLAWLLALYARRSSNGPTTPGLWLPSLVFLVLSIDEVAQFHERFGHALDIVLPGGDRSNTAFDYTGIWGVVVGLPALTALLWMWRQPIFSDQPIAVRRFVVGSVLLIGGAAGLDFVANFTYGPNTVLHGLQIVAEETFELLGATILCWGSLDLLKEEDLLIQLGLVEPLR